MRALLYIFLFLPLGVFAQPGSLDTPALQQGVIKVRRPSVRPYIKCEYYLTLARVQEVEVLVPAANGLPGQMERTRVPVFDSSYSQEFPRVYPQKLVHFSKTLVDAVEFAYPFGDTSSVDTMIVEMWIARNGKIRWKNVDTTLASSMPRQLELELYTAINGMSDWGQGGGYLTPKRFLRKQKRIAENYYCVMYVIASSKPLTNQQRVSGSRYALFDIPLNTPKNPELLKGDSLGRRD